VRLVPSSVLVLALAPLVACDRAGDDGANDTDTPTDTEPGVRPFVPPDVTPSSEPGTFPLALASLRQRYLLSDGGAPSEVVMAQVGTRVFGDLELPELAFTRTSDGSDLGVSLYVGMDGTAAALGGFSTPAALNGVDLDVVLDPPFVIDSRATVGQRQDVSLDGTVSLSPDGAAGEDGFLPVEGGYTLEDDDDVAAPPIGATPGCWRFRFDAAAGPLGATGRVWAHPKLGLVQADIDAGGLGTFQLGSAGYLGWYAEGDLGIVQTEGTIDGVNRRFAVSTRDPSGGPDAARGVPAKVYVEVRYLNDKTARQPPVDVFVSAEGVPFQAPALASSDTPFLHPEQAALGYTWWLTELEAVAPDGAGPSSFDVSVAYQVDDADAIKVGVFVSYERQP
jgi:hypothetical protein